MSYANVSHMSGPSKASDARLFRLQAWMPLALLALLLAICDRAEGRPYFARELGADAVLYTAWLLQHGLGTHISPSIRCNSTANKTVCWLKWEMSGYTILLKVRWYDAQLQSRSFL